MDFPVPATIDDATSALRVFALAAHGWVGFEVARALRRRAIRLPWLWGAVAALPGLALTLTGDLFQFHERLLGGVSRAPGLHRFVAAVWTIGICGAFGLRLVFAAWDGLRRKPGPPAVARSATGALTRRAALTAPFAVAGYGVFIERENFRLREIEVTVPGLPDDLDGLRIGQLTDIHAGTFLEPKQVRRAVAMINEAKPHLAAVTGDLITRPGDPLHATLDALSGLRADAGVWGCMGNHEQFARCRGETQVYGRRKGIEFLRQGSRGLRFGAAEVNLVGVDYQRLHRPYLVGAEATLRPGAFNLLLSHNPDVFPKAAQLGFDLVLSGHTHGGQVRFPLIGSVLCPSWYGTQWDEGIFEGTPTIMHVTRGVSGLTPLRWNCPPEIVALTLQTA